jgi:tetratricopeptide (TPR) repeat protein
MQNEYAIMLTVDTMLAYVAHRLYRRHYTHAAMSVSLLIGVCLVAFAIHLLSVLPLADRYDIATPQGQAIITRSLVYFGLIPALLFARLAREVVSHSVSQGLYGLDTGIRPKREFSRARALKARGDIKEAIDEFRRAYREDDSEAIPLFEIAEIEASLQHYHDAIDVLREVTGKFKDNDTDWERAAFRMAEIYQHHLNDISAARGLFREITRRSPTSELGNMAHLRLADLRAGEKSLNDPLTDHNTPTR